MLGDSYLYLQLAKERAKEGLRRAEQARHIQASRGDQKRAKTVAAGGPDAWCLASDRHYTAKLIDRSEEVHP